MIHNFLTNRIVLQTSRINWHSNILQGDFTITLRKSLVSQYQHISHVILFVFGFGGTIWRVPIYASLPSKLVTLFLDNKSSYKMVRISSHPLGSFPSPHQIYLTGKLPRPNILRNSWRNYPDVSEFYQKYVMAFPGFVISPIWQFLVWLATITVMLSLGTGWEKNIKI